MGNCQSEQQNCCCEPAVGTNTIRAASAIAVLFAVIEIGLAAGTYSWTSGPAKNHFGNIGLGVILVITSVLGAFSVSRGVVIAALIFAVITFLTGLSSYFIDPLLSNIFATDPYAACINKDGTKLTGPGQNQIKIATIENSCHTYSQYTCTCSFAAVQSFGNVSLTCGYFDHEGSNDCDFFTNFVPLYKAVAGFEVVCGILAIIIIILTSVSLCFPSCFKTCGDVPSSGTDVESAQPNPGIAMTPTIQQGTYIGGSGVQQGVIVGGTIVGGAYAPVPTVPIVVPSPAATQQSITCQKCNQAFSFVRSYAGQSSAYCSHCGAMNIVSV